MLTLITSYSDVFLKFCQGGEWINIKWNPGQDFSLESPLKVSLKNLYFFTQSSLMWALLVGVVQVEPLLLSVCLAIKPSICHYWS